MNLVALIGYANPFQVMLSRETLFAAFTKFKSDIFHGKNHIDCPPCSKIDRQSSIYEGLVNSSIQEQVNGRLAACLGRMLNKMGMRAMVYEISHSIIVWNQMKLDRYNKKVARFGKHI